MQLNAVGRRAVICGSYGHGVRGIAHAVAAARTVLQNEFNELTCVELQWRTCGQL